MDRVAVVTGAAQGIGFAISRALLQSGFTVTGIDFNGGKLAVAESLLTGDGLSFASITADVSDSEHVARAFDEIRQNQGGIDVLVNNAGTCFVTDFIHITPDEFRRQMAVNFDSAFYCCQQAIPLMLSRPGIKKIINISSNGAYNFEVFDPAHYRASKAAMDNLTKHIARRYAKEGVVINSIAPAMTRTDLFDIVEPDMLEKAIADMPQGKPMEPEEIAAWVTFLASPAGDCASGNVIILNQGRDVR